MWVVVVGGGVVCVCVCVCIYVCVWGGISDQGFFWYPMVFVFIFIREKLGTKNLILFFPELVLLIQTGFTSARSSTRGVARDDVKCDQPSCHPCLCGSKHRAVCVGCGERRDLI